MNELVIIRAEYSVMESIVMNDKSPENVRHFESFKLESPDEALEDFIREVFAIVFANYEVTLRTALINIDLVLAEITASSLPIVLRLSLFKLETDELKDDYIWKELLSMFNRIEHVFNIKITVEQRRAILTAILHHPDREVSE